MRQCANPRYKDRLINPGDTVRISDDAEEDSPNTQDESLVRSEHAGEEGRYIEDIVTQCKVRFAVVELAGGTRVLIRKQYVDPLPAQAGSGS